MLNNPKYELVFVTITFVIFAVLPVGTEPKSEKDSFPWLLTFEVGDYAKTFRSNDEVVKTGRKLARLPIGVHSLEEGQENAPVVLIGIHGLGIHGYEWVYPLDTLDSDNIHIFFYRWNSWYPQPKSQEILLKAIDKIAEDRQTPLDKVVLLAHSCGGVLAISTIEELRSDIQFEIHTIAAPLNGLGIFTFCEPDLPVTIPKNVIVKQWRTTRIKDSVFWWFGEDPQVVSIDPSETVRLPPYYRGVRLGHVRSISWVAEQLVADLTEEGDGIKPLASSETCN